MNPLFLQNCHIKIKTIKWKWELLHPVARLQEFPIISTFP